MAAQQRPPASEVYQWPPPEHEDFPTAPIEFMNFSSPSIAKPLPLPLTLPQYVYTEPIVSAPASTLTLDQFLSCDFSMDFPFGQSDSSQPSSVPSDTESWFLDPPETKISVHGENSTYLAPTKAAIAFYQCRICLEIAKEPVVTSCGHLFCWPCLHSRLWSLETNPTMNGIKKCPVCSNEIIESLIFPIEAKDDEENLFSKFVAPRPRGIHLAPRN